MKRTTAWVTSSGKALASLEAAQLDELESLFHESGDDAKKAIATCLLQNKDKIVDILTTTENSRPSARRINGGSKKRKTVPMPEAKASA